MSSGKMTSVLRYHFRRAVYGTALAKLIRSRSAFGSGESATAQWDSMMSGRFAAYLDRTVSVGSRDALLATLIRSSHPEARSLLDLGCGAGALAEMAAMVGITHYEGRDVSTVAIRRAQELQAGARTQYPIRCHFDTGDIRAPKWEETVAFDVIVFSEVLYYLGQPAEAVSTVESCMKWLAPSGLICVAMKDDAKSHAIFKLLTKRLEWVGGVLFQEKISEPDFRVRVSRERPGYLIAALRRKKL